MKTIIGLITVVLLSVAPLQTSKEITYPLDTFKEILITFWSKGYKAGSISALDAKNIKNQNQYATVVVSKYKLDSIEMYKTIEKVFSTNKFN